MTRPSSMPKIVPNPSPSVEIVPNPNPLFRAQPERRILPTPPPSTPPLR
ncbi:hypothetical protein POL68_26815 [Stigmatella sp. ncwal1]|uniref:Uncharacterized protein n=1 Tax=Stigmatella ashevillensis TaxID=2995309 RepID=A0ABT5DEL1_9BACT|nr:hypothetical protein [Stigmatella ashevillena]MDC0712107.1 hypothetical protein [Stigmatella ashevillena]